MKIKLYKGKSGILRNVHEFDKMQKAGEVVYSFGYEGGLTESWGR